MTVPSKKYNIVITSRQIWEETHLGSNIRDMARVLSQSHQVLFVNDPLDWSAVISQKSGRAALRREFLAKHQGQRLIQDGNNLWVLNPESVIASINWLPDGALYDWFNRINTQKIAREIIAAVQKLGWDSFILINDNDMLQGFFMKELLQPKVSVYYLRDNFLAVDFWRKHGLRLEPLLMKKVDMIASNSIYLANQAGRYNPTSVYVGQGCDLQLFDSGKIDGIPADLQAIPHPRIGYAGALTGLRLDGELLETVARQRPDWQVILIGSTDDSFPVERLKTLPNIHFLGSKTPQQIPAYLEGMDVLINPQKLNEVTIGNYPRKIDEYLAMGKPIVAVKTETMSLFKDHVNLAETSDAFIAHIEDILRGKELSTAGERIAFAHQHSWENSVGDLIQAIENRFLSKIPSKK
ncbi:glycosyltransferase [Runella slithyformis]|uniref:Glycosyl transferase group 1 n=1 Tax=Runella slithyformis (strain ATCC 29530 / DSM 19594 / LMG 11500 / NCIMB 11436 / LSU 4) TaxID=761193 RepID=A0A7U4E734_RUNSL|nr:glycosyltransferase [Runella slithyformis]AEI49769.1 glycosyl transferase group 1 [Runella slithyformis DSM 19594]